MDITPKPKGHVPGGDSNEVFRSAGTPIRTRTTIHGCDVGCAEARRASGAAPLRRSRGSRRGPTSPWPGGRRSSGGVDTLGNQLLHGQSLPGAEVRSTTGRRLPWKSDGDRPWDVSERRSNSTLAGGGSLMAEVDNASETTSASVAEKASPTASSRAFFSSSSQVYSISCWVSRSTRLVWVPRRCRARGSLSQPVLLVRGCDAPARTGGRGEYRGGTSSTWTGASISTTCATHSAIRPRPISWISFPPSRMGRTSL